MPSRLLRPAALALMLAAGVAHAPAVLAQAKLNRTLVPIARPAVPTDPDGRNADQVRSDFERLMRQYPPSLGEVMKLDPTLMTNDAYLQNDPAVAAFLAAHPEIPRDPTFFLNFAQTAREVNDDSSRNHYSPIANQVNSIIDFTGVALVFAGVATVLFWLVRTILGHRRWLRSTKLQMDLHNRLMERLSTTADVQAYLESAATNRLLLDMPVSIDGATRSVGAPINRIMWSVQTGIVLGAAGVGLLVSQRYWPDGENVLTIPGILVLAVGVGFCLAAIASYILSNRLGLLEPPVSVAERPGA